MFLASAAAEEWWERGQDTWCYKDDWKSQFLSNASTFQTTLELPAETIQAAVSELINRAVFGFGHSLFNPFRRDVLTLVLVYLVLQGVFLVGSVYFRKLAFVKTSLFMMGVVVGLAVVLGAVTGAILWDSRAPGTHGIRLTDELIRRASGSDSSTSRGSRPLRF